MQKFTNPDPIAGLLRAGQFVEARALLKPLVVRALTQVKPRVIPEKERKYLIEICVNGLRCGLADDVRRLIETVIAKNPQWVEGKVVQAIAREKTGSLHEALTDFKDIADLRPNDPSHWVNLGNVQFKLARYQDAVHAFSRAIVLQAAHAEAFANRGAAFRALRKFEEALADYNEAIRLRPNFAEAHNNRANLLIEIGDFDGALAASDQALIYSSERIEIWLSRAAIFRGLKQHGQARDCLLRAYALNGKFPFLLGMLIQSKAQVCDWEGFENLTDQLNRQVEAGDVVCTPFLSIAISDDPGLQLRVAQRYVAHQRWNRQEPIPSIGPCADSPERSSRLRLGYFTADFFEHATAYLMAEHFEVIDRSKYELIVFNLSSRPEDRMGARIRSNVDEWLDVAGLSDDQVATMARSKNIDLAIDLKGYTAESRPGIFAYRCAPVQVSYLGYPGTLGLEVMDYLIADKHLVDDNGASFFQEKVVRLACSYQLNDRQRCASQRYNNRSDVCLPDGVFVYCCFNSSYKITPHWFTVWMSILKQTDRSVLWLLEDCADTTQNLQAHAVQRGVDPSRLIFAPRLSIEDHLSRLRFADLFIDTFPCNAHTTASDALWCGVPVLTCQGRSFASRVGSSLNASLGMDWFTTSTAELFKEKAVLCAADAQFLANQKLRLSENRTKADLFNPEVATRMLTVAFDHMTKLSRSGKQPEAFDLDLLASGRLAIRTGQSIATIHT